MWRRPKCRVLAVKVAQTIPQWLYMARNDCQPHRARRGTIGKIGPNGIIGATRMPSSKMPIFAFHSQHVVQIRSGAKYSDIISLIWELWPLIDHVNKTSPKLPTVRRVGAGHKTKTNQWQDFIDREQNSVDYLIQNSFATLRKGKLNNLSTFPYYC